MGVVFLFLHCDGVFFERFSLSSIMLRSTRNSHNTSTLQPHLHPVKFLRLVLRVVVRMSLLLFHVSPLGAQRIEDIIDVSKLDLNEKVTN